ncbi:MAG TPA: hypothetical protein VHE83_17185, partial [Mycobacteriales bacterium]|nr:hypothetical protein [Mycobacteriales bacterium]
MTSDVAVGRREPASGPGGSGRREPASGPGGSGRREPASGPGGPARGSDLSAAVADAFTREVGSRLPGLRSWLAAAVRPGAEPDADGLAEALRA